MTVTVERPSVVTDRPLRSAVPAGVASALTIPGLAVAVAVAAAIGTVLGVDWASPDKFSATELAALMPPAILVSLTAPLAGLILGVRAARSGDSSGRKAAWLAAALLTLVVALWVCLIGEWIWGS